MAIYVRSFFLTCQAHPRATRLQKLVWCWFRPGVDSATESSQEVFSHVAEKLMCPKTGILFSPRISCNGNARAHKCLVACRVLIVVHIFYLGSRIFFNNDLRLEMAAKLFDILLWTFPWFY